MHFLQVFPNFPSECICQYHMEYIFLSILSIMKDILSKIFFYYLEKLYHSFNLHLFDLLILGFMKSVAKIIFLKYISVLFLFVLLFT